MIHHDTSHLPFSCARFPEAFSSSFFLFPCAAYACSLISCSIRLNPSIALRWEVIDSLRLFFVLLPVCFRSSSGGYQQRHRKTLGFDDAWKFMIFWSQSEFRWLKKHHFRFTSGPLSVADTCEGVSHDRALVWQQHWSLFELNRVIKRLDIVTSGSLPVRVS